MDSSSAVLKDRSDLLEDPSDQTEETTAGAAGQSLATISRQRRGTVHPGSLHAVTPGRGAA